MCYFKSLLIFFILSKFNLEKKKKTKFDNSAEYVNHEFSKFLSHKSIIHELTRVNIPQQYGVAKRKNCHLLEVVRAFFFYMYVPKSYEGEVGLMVTYLINRLHICVFNDIIPIEFIFSFVHSSRFVSSLSWIFRWAVFVTLIILVTVN